MARTGTLWVAEAVPHPVRPTTTTPLSRPATTSCHLTPMGRRYRCGTGSRFATTRVVALVDCEGLS